MAKIREILSFINKAFPNAERTQKEGGDFILHPTHAPPLEHLLKMLDEIDEAHLQLSDANLNCLGVCKATIKQYLRDLQSRGPTITLRKTPGYGRENPVILICRLLKESPLFKFLNS